MISPLSHLIQQQVNCLNNNLKKSWQKTSIQLQFILRAQNLAIRSFIQVKCLGDRTNSFKIEFQRQENQELGLNLLEPQKMFVLDLKFPRRPMKRASSSLILFTIITQRGKILMRQRAFLLRMSQLLVFIIREATLI